MGFVRLDLPYIQAVQVSKTVIVVDVRRPIRPQGSGTGGVLQVDVGVVFEGDQEFGTIGKQGIETSAGFQSPLV